MKYKLSLASLLVLALAGVGCGGTPTPPSPSTGTTPSAPVADSRASGRCLNAYYPLEAGSKITYKMRSGNMDVPFAVEVLAHDAGGIKLEYTFTVEGREVKVTNELVCENGTIKGKGHFDMASAFLGLDIKYDILEMTGEIMPADLVVGREWTMNNKVRMNVTDTTTPIGQMMNGRIATTKIVSKVVGEESVIVPAGTFRALKIEQAVTSGGDIAGRAYTNTTTNYAWYVKDVGLVKSQSTGAGSGFTMEAATIRP